MSLAAVSYGLDEHEQVYTSVFITRRHVTWLSGTLWRGHVLLLGLSVTHERCRFSTTGLNSATYEAYILPKT